MIAAQLRFALFVVIVLAGPAAVILLRGPAMADPGKLVLIPAHLNIAMFAVLATAPLALTLSFIVSCVVFRELLTQLRERARTWWAAAAGHAAPNMFLAAMAAVGLTGLDAPHPWILFPVPGGLVFLGLVVGAVVFLYRTRSPREHENVQPAS